MDLKEYQKEIARFDLHIISPLPYALGLCAEAGEVAAVFEKHARKHSDGDYLGDKVRDELGDVLFYLTRLADYYEISLEEVAERNVAKLQGRLDAGTLVER